MRVDPDILLDVWIGFKLGNRGRLKRFGYLLPFSVDPQLPSSSEIYLNKENTGFVGFNWHSHQELNLLNFLNYSHLSWFKKNCSQNST